MKIQLRLILSLLLIISLSFYFLFDLVINDIRPRYLEAVEESMNDTANILASLLETEMKQDKINLISLKNTFNNVLNKKFSAQIYQVIKTNVDVDVYVVDNKGIVLYDSGDPQNIGRDFSRWNDVYLALQGKYGARGTRKIKNNPASVLLYVAAPITRQNKIIGAVTIVKPQDSVSLFMEIARKKMNLVLLITFFIILFMSIIISTWITRPVIKLINYVKDIKLQKKIVLPDLGTTEIKDLGIAFEGLLEELEGKKYIEQYVQSLTHEIKSPLSSIAGAAELLEEDLPEEQRLKFYNNIKREAQRIKTITDKLLYLSAVENQKELKEVKEINCYTLFHNIISSLEPQIRQKQINIINSIGQEFLIKGEEFLLHHAFANLLQNAVNFSPEKSEIHIQARQDNNLISISIIDEGSGIPDFAINKIFEKFYSLPPLDTNKKSTGLGLPFVKEVVLLHKGIIEIKNNSQTGVTAIVTLPVEK